MTAPLFSVLIRIKGQRYSLGIYQRRCNQMVYAVQKFMSDKVVRSRIGVDTHIDPHGDEWLQFNLSASLQIDLWRPDTALQEQVEQEAQEIRQQLLSRVSGLSASTDEIRLNPSRFWEICPGVSFLMGL